MNDTLASEAVTIISELWEEMLNFPLQEETKGSILTILIQVPEFSTYMVQDGEIDLNKCELFVTSLFMIYRSGYNRPLTKNDKDLIFIGTEYITRNQEELFGIQQTIPQPILYHAIMTIAVTFDQRKNIPKVSNANIQMVQTYCRHAVHLYVQFLQDILSTLGQRLGVITYPIE